MLFCKRIHSCVLPVSSLVSRAGVRKRQHSLGDSGGKEIIFWMPSNKEGISHI